MRSFRVCFSLIAKLCCFVPLLLSGCLLPPGQGGRGSGTAKTIFNKPYKRILPQGVSTRITVNQVSLPSSRRHWAVIESTVPINSFTVEDANGKVLARHSGLADEQFTSFGGGPYFYRADFSDVAGPGVIYIKAGGVTSLPVYLENESLFKKIWPLLIGYFNKSRADDPAVLRADANLSFYGMDQRQTPRVDLRGGWYDASGDISKYLTHLSYANFMNPQQIPLTVWALARVAGDAGIPLSAAQRAAALDEAHFGADFLVRMKSPAGYFYATVFDHWSGVLAQRTICAFSGREGVMSAKWQAAFREGGGVAIAALARASTLDGHGAYSTARYLSTARVAFDHLSKHNLEYCDDGKENIIDDYTALLAASELFAATRETAYLAQARARATGLLDRLSDSGTFIADGGNRPFWHASDEGLPIVALVRYARLESDAKMVNKVLSGVVSAMSALIERTGSVANPYQLARQSVWVDGESVNRFFAPHQNESGYWWQGENARLASLATAAFDAARWLVEQGEPVRLSADALWRFGQSQLDWILGRNPFGICFLRGAGTVHPEPYSVYPDAKGFGDLDGGIANGITGAKEDGTGIAFFGYDGFTCERRERWRWLEQWLPHATWMLLAASADAR